MKRRGMRGLLFATLALTFAMSGVAAIPPPGATALCRDGTYSYSQHHSGTCSHHGGVAKWLGSSSSSSSTTSTGTRSPAPPKATIPLGKTVLLHHRTKTSGCKLGPLPDRRCSPGADYSKLTKAVICSSSFRTSQVRHVTTSEKHAVEVEYGLAAESYGRTLEIDHIVSLELGGSNSIANLYPEEARFGSSAPGYHVKDKLENKLHKLVCAGDMTLRAAQRGIAANWEKLYRKVYGVAPH